MVLAPGAGNGVRTFSICFLSQRNAIYQLLHAYLPCKQEPAWEGGSLGPGSLYLNQVSQETA